MPSQVRVIQAYLSGSEMLKGVRVVLSTGYEDLRHPETGAGASDPGTGEGTISSERYSSNDDLYGYTYLIREGHNPWIPVVRWESGEETDKGRVIGYGSENGHIICKAVAPSPHRSWSDVLQIVKAFRRNLQDMDVSGL